LERKSATSGSDVQEFPDHRTGATRSGAGETSPREGMRDSRPARATRSTPSYRHPPESRPADPSPGPTGPRTPRDRFGRWRAIPPSFRQEPARRKYENIQNIFTFRLINGSSLA